MDRSSRRIDQAPLEVPGLASVRSRSKIRSQDLVSLPVLRALLQERNITRAGEVVGLTQPAVSNALARLRRRFGDDLLIRVGREYQLTPLGQILLDRAESAFDALERLFEDHFDPATSTRQFSLALSDYSIAVLAEALMQILRAEAPSVRLDLQQLSTSAVNFEETLRQSDGVILPPEYVLGHPSMKLIRDRWVCMVARDNPRVTDVVTTADLSEMPWVASFGRSIFSTSPPVRQLRALGIEPNVEITVDSFQAVPFLLAGTDRIAFMPERLAQRFTALTATRVVPSPLPFAEHLLAMYWDAIETNDPGHRWFRSVLSRAAGSLHPAD